MKIVYLHQYFVTPSEAGGNRSYYLASKLASLGHEVVVITSNYQYDDWPFVKTTNENGFKVVYIKNRFESKMGKLRRLIAYFRFMLLATYFSLSQKNTDLIYASSTPLLIGIPAIALKIRSKAAFVFELRDLWPDVPYELGYVRSKIVFKIMKSLEYYLYKKSDLIVTISDGIKERIPEAYRNKAVTYPFGAELSNFTASADLSWRADNSIDADTLVVYTGAIGWANGFDLLLDAAGDLLKEDVSVHIALIGVGSALEHVKQRVEKEKLSNISIFPPVAAKELNQIYASADVGLILFGSASDTYYNTASPNKFFDYIAAGLPFIYHFGGPLSDEVEHFAVGRKVKKDSRESLLQCLKDMHLGVGPVLRDRVAIRAVAEKQWDKQRILTELAVCLDQIRPKANM